MRPARSLDCNDKFVVAERMLGSVGTHPRIDADVLEGAIAIPHGYGHHETAAGRAPSGVPALTSTRSLPRVRMRSIR